MKAGDPEMTRMEPTIYDHSLLVAFRKIAKKYGILENIFILKIKSKEEGAIEISPTGFDKEFRVVLGENFLVKDNAYNELSDYHYCLWENDGSFYFDYKPKAVNDQVFIYYSANVTNENFTKFNHPVIPERYRDEIISHALNEVAKIGIMSSFDEVNLQRYKSLLQIYPDSKLVPIDPQNTKNQGITVIKPYTVF